MKTDDLIELLSTNVEPVPRRRVGWILGGAIAISAAAAVAAMVFAHGVRPDMGQANVWTALLLKLAFTVGILVPASIYLIRLARPGGERKTPVGLVILPFAIIMLVAAANLAFAPVSHWEGIGSNVCCRSRSSPSSRSRSSSWRFARWRRPT
jgi:hypothetical protein